MRSLRVSVTDRCNLRCLYCMPEEDYVWLPREALLTFEELAQLVERFTDLGVTRVRLTGGEPLLRRDLDKLVSMLAANSRIEDLALTTNGVLLADQAEALKRAGLHRVTISLDTLRPERFAAITRRDDHDRVLAGIDAAQRAGFTGTKLDAVIVRGVNDDELADLIDFGRATGAELRFIEYMDVPGATKWTTPKVFSRDEMLRQLEQRFGKSPPSRKRARRPLRVSCCPTARFSELSPPPLLPFAVAATAAVSPPTACGTAVSTQQPARTCAALLRAGAASKNMPRAGAANKNQIVSVIEDAWRGRDDRGAEQRVAQRFRAAFVPLEELRGDPHLEMHTRGG